MLLGLVRHRVTQVAALQQTSPEPLGQKTERRSCMELALSCFDGARPLEPYVAQVDVAALYNGWDQHKAAAHFLLSNRQRFQRHTQFTSRVVRGVQCHVLVDLF